MPSRYEHPPELQSLLFDEDLWTPGEAKQWAREHGFESGYADRPTGRGRFIRIRQQQPIEGYEKRTRTMSREHGIKAIWQFPEVENPGEDYEIELEGFGDIDVD